MKSELISVLMPVFNAEAYVLDAIISILNQTHKNFEIIAVNDGSTDSSYDLLMHAQAGDSRIRLISRPNTGIVKALNDGLSVASGAYLARMDADDLCRPSRLAKQVRLLTDNPSLIAVGTGWRYLDLQGREEPAQDVLIDHKQIEQCLLLGDAQAMLHGSIMMRTDAVRKVGGYRQHARNYYEELDLYLRLSRLGRFSNVPQDLYLYRRSPSGNNAAASKEGFKQEALYAILQAAYAERGMAFPPDWDAEWKKVNPVRFWTHEVWYGLREGNRRRAIRGGIRSALAGPLNLSCWKALACALRGR